MKRMTTNNSTGMLTARRRTKSSTFVTPSNNNRLGSSAPAGSSSRSAAPPPDTPQNNSNAHQATDDILLFGDSAAVHDDLRRTLMAESTQLESQTQALAELHRKESQQSQQLGRDHGLAQAELQDLVRTGHETVDTLKIHQDLLQGNIREASRLLPMDSSSCHSLLGSRGMHVHVVPQEGDEQEPTNENQDPSDTTKNPDDKNNNNNGGTPKGEGGGNNDHSNMTLRLAEQTAVVDQMEGDLARAMEDFRNNSQEKAHWKDQAAALRRRVLQDDNCLLQMAERAEQEAKAQESALEEERVRRDNLRTTMQCQREEEEKATAQLKADEAKFAEATKAAKEVEKELEAILAGLKAKNAESKKLVNHAQERAAQLEALETQLKQATEHIQNVQTRIEEQINLRNKIKGHRQQVHTRKLKLEAQLSEANQEHAKVQAQLANMVESETNKIRNLKKKNDALEKFKTERTQDLEAMRQSLAEVEEKLREIDENADVPSDEFKALLGELEENRAKVKEAEGWLEKAKQDNETAREKIEQFVQMDADLKHTWDAQRKTMQAELKAHQDELANLKATLEERQEVFDQIEKRASAHRKLEVLRRGVAVKRQTLEEERELTDV